MSETNKLLQSLANDASSIAAYTASIGKQIVFIELDGDDILHFVFTDGSKLRVADDAQYCCEHRYMSTDDVLAEYVGATLLGMEIKDAPNVLTDDETHEVQFLEVQTSKGVITFANHNEHNGYYSGFYICLSAE